MFAPFYSPVCEDDEYVVGETDFDCRHMNFRGMGLVPLAAGAAAGGPPGWIIGAALTGVTTLIGLFSNRKRGKQKIATTQIVNEAEPLLQQNLAAWQGSDHYESQQIQALANFDSIWSAVVSQCSDPAFGPPGQWCVDDRKRGGKWDWFARYRDPITDDPNVQSDPSWTEQLLPSQLVNVDEKTLMGLVGVGLLVGAMLLGGQK